ncbi:MAG: cobalamin-dependent protein [Ignavibacteriales bacterium]|jgi:methanogenic corrinoid protein MtbC1|nr:cobalamin-dependent protein [Ignavibacteriales bacterium]
MKEIKQSHFLSFFNSLVDGEKEKCTHIVQSLLNDGYDLKDIYNELFKKSLYRIGKLWDHDKMSIPEEHMATQIVESLISRFAPVGNSNSDRKVVVTCIDKEFHEIGAKMVSNVFELEGWNSYYLGASVPSKEILKFVKQIDPEVIALSWSLYLNLGRFLDVVDHLTRFFPTKKIIVGGQALAENSDKVLKKYKNVEYIDSLHSLEAYLKK